MDSIFPSATVDGFEMGMFVSYDDCGDAWVKAPDGSEATLVWETGEHTYFQVSIEPNESSWGTFAVQLQLPMTTDEEAHAYLAALLPDLRLRWQAWRAAHDLPGEWSVVLGTDEADGLARELLREVSIAHVLHGALAEAVIAKRQRKDVVFRLPTSGRWAYVHLTYRVETDPHWPTTVIADNWAELAHQLT